MAANRGATLFVLLLYCCHRAEQPVNTSSGIVAVDRVADEILVQEILNPNKSSRSGTTKTASTSSPAMLKGKKTVIDENAEDYAEPPNNAHSSPNNEDQRFNNESSGNNSYQVGGSVDHGKKNSKNDPDESISVLDKILQKIGKFSGNLSSKLKRTSKAQRAESGQRGHQLREISVKNEILTE
ncbi:sperm acrosome-associated protein 7 [Pipistrellus kuhlii]|uniref:sperm acrosome-associated protein 7 n=1 Tax=Pipistrellus kuhlii TaxID=59472 RepID=UPI00174EFB7B|nr:sperm acrosome-associated protein 7 [Pipistrellus kuhlii]